MQWVLIFVKRVKAWNIQQAEHIAMLGGRHDNNNLIRGHDGELKYDVLPGQPAVY